MVGTKREVVGTALQLAGQAWTLTYDTSRRARGVNGVPPLSGLDPTGFGELWLSSLHKQLSVAMDRRGARASRGDGRVVSFSGNGAGSFTTDGDVSDRLVGISGGGYRYMDAEARALETYDASGKLTAITHAGGQSLSFVHSDANNPIAIASKPGLLIQVLDGFGRSLRFEYELPSGSSTARVSKIIDAAELAVVPAYDLNGNLAQLTWSDGAVRRFVYDHPTLPWALTGVVDERAIRRSTFDYDSEGRAKSTEHAGGVNRYSVTYAAPPQILVSESYDASSNILYRTKTWQLPQAPVVTLPNGASSSLGVAAVLDTPRVTSRSQPAGSGCDASTSSTAYDVYGNVAVKDDFNGSRICYASDLTRNLETVRIEGLANTASCAALTPANSVLPSGSRKISTEWHPDWALQTKRAEPTGLTTYVYNGQPDPFNANAIASCAPGTALLPDGKPIAVLCKQVEQATTDVDGRSGFGGTLQAGVASRQTSWTYNGFGQVLTEDGPRTDVSDVTTYAYYSDTTADHTTGDISQVTNAAGQVTQYTKYNKHGQVLQTIDSNGVVTDIAYDLRQRLTSVSVGGQITSYLYEPFGQLKRVTLPDASFVRYEYDDAHRLKAIEDSTGNRIDYTLDNTGKRVQEQVKDSSGTLARQLSRSIDALGRVQQATGTE